MQPRKVNIDQSTYLVDDEKRQYRFLQRNPQWRKLSPQENEANKRSIEKYTRMMRSGKRKDIDARNTPDGKQLCSQVTTTA